MNFETEFDVLASNAAEDWIAAALGLVLTLLLLLLLRWVAVRFTERGPQEGAATPLRRFIASIQRQTSIPIIVLVSLIVGLVNLTLPEILERALYAGIVLVVLIQVGLWGREAITYLLRRHLERDSDAGSRGAVEAGRYIGTLILWSLLAILFLDNIGVEITSLVAGLGIGGIALGLAARNVLGDLFASLAIVLDRPFVTGDFVVGRDVSGSVERIGIKTTHLRSPSGEQLVVSNSHMLNAPIRNYGRMERRRVVLSLGFTYDTAAEKMEAIPEMIREAVEQHSEISFDRAHFRSFGESALQVEAVYYFQTANFGVYADTQQEINLELLRRFRAEGIEFAFPTRAIHVSGQLPSPQD